MDKRWLFSLLVSLSGIMSCRESSVNEIPQGYINPLELTSRPYTHYWWFASVIMEEELKII